MQRASIAAVATAVLAAGVVVSREEGLDAVGAGLLGGALLGGAVALLAHTLVGIGLRHDTVRAFKYVAMGFFAKAVGAILPWSVLAAWPRAGAYADPTAYLLAYVSAVLLVLAAGVFDHLRTAAALSDESAEAAEGSLVHSVPSGSSGSLESAS
ncbi:MAG: hypothetical protein AAF726_21160 [Planctomycetota bacterium]